MVRILSLKMEAVGSSLPNATYHYFLQKKRLIGMLPAAQKGISPHRQSHERVSSEVSNSLQGLDN